MTDVKNVSLLLDMTRAIDRDFAKGISKYARLYSRTPWAFYSEPGDHEILKILSKLKKWGAHGIIANDPTPKHTKAIIESNLPAITRGIKIPGCPHISSNSKSISRMAASYLFERAYTHFAYCGYDWVEWSLLRATFFVKEIIALGGDVTIYEQPKRKKWLSWEKEQTYMVNWLESLPKPIAIMACNDDRARQVIEASKAINIHIPEEMAVLGVDNDEFVCELSTPPLSSINLNSERAGFQAAKLLDDMMQNNSQAEEEIIVEPTHIITRQSTDMLAISDPEVATAINFIRKNAKKLVQVNDVVEATTLSRRVLEKRFRKYRRRSILEEINQIRVHQVIQLLVETNLSVSEIATVMGCPSDKHIARSFHKHMGMSPLAYRKRYGNR